MSGDGISTLTYEQALAELDGLITKLEGGAVELDEAIACYERGSRLAQRCAELLDRTEQAVAQLVVGAGGRVEERPLPVTANGGMGEPEAAPPPTTSSAPRARAVGKTPPAGLFPGLDDERAGRPVRPPSIDPDEIPF